MQSLATIINRVLTGSVLQRASLW